MKHSSTDDATTLRKADIKVGLVIFVILLGLMYLTVQFPMSGSYGGVENQWYVSPALFPLVLLGILMVCTLYLLVHGLRQVGWAQGVQSLGALNGWLGDLGQERNRNVWFVIFMLLAYVYVYLTRVDFYLCTVLFMMTLMSRFYLSSQGLNLAAIGINLAVCALLWSVPLWTDGEFGLLLERPTDIAAQIKWGDGLVFTALIALLVCAITTKAMTLKQSLAIFYTAILTPFILVVVFNFLLYVPMPVEYGTVMNFLTYVAYDVIGL